MSTPRCQPWSTTPIESDAHVLVGRKAGSDDKRLPPIRGMLGIMEPMPRWYRVGRYVFWILAALLAAAFIVVLALLLLYQPS